MIGLAIHTSSPELGLALIDLTTSTDRHHSWPLGRDLATYLHPCLMEFLPPYRWTDLAFIAVAKGPGGFTGTRIGVVVARTLAQQLGLPLFGVSSLAAIAQQYHQSTPLQADTPVTIAVTMAAQRGEVFGAVFQRHATGITPIRPDGIFSRADWDATLAHGPRHYHLITAQAGLAESVTAVLAIATQQWQRGDRPNWQTVLPFYGQHPVRL